MTIDPEKERIFREVLEIDIPTYDVDELKRNEPRLFEAIMTSMQMYLFQVTVGRAEVDPLLGLKRDVEEARGQSEKMAELAERSNEALSEATRVLIKNRRKRTLLRIAAATGTSYMIIDMLSKLLS